MVDVTRIIGNPGTGKTTELVRRFIGLIEEGVCADEICYLTFTRKATQEARTRISSATGYEASTFNWIRTIHSFSYFTQGIDRGQLLAEDEYDNIRNAAGITDPQEIMVIQNAHAYHLLTDSPILECWERFQGSYPTSWSKLLKYAQIYAQYKQTLGKLDYHDLLQKYVNNPRVPTFHTLIVDEAQDLSALQWQIINLVAAKAQNLIIAGDPHQAIYQWCGAESNIFSEYPVNEEIILPQSFRIPIAVQQYSLRVLERFSDVSRYPYEPRPGEIGTVCHTPRLNLPKLLSDNGQESYLFLSRNECFLKDVQTYLYKVGTPYETLGAKGEKDKIIRRIEWYNEATFTKELTGKKKIELNRLCSDLESSIIKSMPWYEAFDALNRQQKEYYYNLLNSEGRNVKLGTIHASKGGEADHVILLGDYTGIVEKSFQINSAQEYATLYVGATRAKKSLTLIDPTRVNGYNWRQFL